MYRATEEEIRKAQEEYKKRYPPFRPFFPARRDLEHAVSGFANLITTQNGMDTDDYCVGDNNKVERYLGRFSAGTKVLLLGVGTGRETRVAKDLGFVVRGTTLGSRNIDYGCEYVGLSPEEHVECLNEALPYDSGMFDVVAGFQVFEHAVAPLLFLLEQNRVLRVGGLLLLEWPPASMFSMEDNPHHQVCFSPGQAYALFQKAGFGDIRVYYDDMTEISDEDMWRGDQNKMLCIEGTKLVPNKQYLIDAQRRK